MPALAGLAILEKWKGSQFLSYEGDADHQLSASPTALITSFSSLAGSWPTQALVTTPLRFTRSNVGVPGTFNPPSNDCLTSLMSTPRLARYLLLSSMLPGKTATTFA